MELPPLDSDALKQLIEETGNLDREKFASVVLTTP